MFVKNHTLTVQERNLQTKYINDVIRTLNNNKHLYKLDKELFRQLIIKELPGFEFNNCSIQDIANKNEIECRLHKQGNRYMTMSYIDFCDKVDGYYYVETIELYKDTDDHQKLENIIEMIKLDFFIKTIKELGWDK